MNMNYICLAGYPEDQNESGPVSVIISEMEPFGDINILSIYTLPNHRRKGMLRN